MLQDAHRTCAPSAASVSISTAVWIVMCSDPVTRAPRSGWAALYSARTAISPGISCSASWISFLPNVASERSATLNGTVWAGMDILHGRRSRRPAAPPRHLPTVGHAAFLTQKR